MQTSQAKLDNHGAKTSHRQKETQQLLASHCPEGNQIMETSHYMEITQSVIAERQTMKETQVYRTSH